MPAPKSRWKPGPHSKRLLVGNIDGRTLVGRELRDTLNALAEPLGGLENVTAAQRLILDRAAEKSVRCRMLFDRLTDDPDPTPESERLYAIWSNSLARDLAALGLLDIKEHHRAKRRRAEAEAGSAPPDPLAYAEQRKGEADAHP